MIPLDLTVILKITNDVYVLSLGNSQYRKQNKKTQKKPHSQFSIFTLSSISLSSLMCPVLVVDIYVLLDLFQLFTYIYMYMER